MQCIQNMKRLCLHCKQEGKAHSVEHIKNKNAANTFPQYEENKTLFLAGPVAALSLANL